MQAEQIEIASFIQQYPPFNALPEETVKRIAMHVEISYFRAGTDVYCYGEDIHDFCVIRSGSVEVYRRNGDLYDRLSEGGSFGQLGLLMGNRVRYPARALEDTLIYFIPELLFTELYEQFDAFAFYADVDSNQPLSRAVSSERESNTLMTSKVTSLIARAPVTIASTASIREAAQMMANEDVSSLLVMDNVAPQNAPESLCLSGIITDRDLRVRVLAAEADVQALVTTVMSLDPVTLDPDAYAFEAMLTMLRYNLQHLPVVDDGRPIGVLATSDLVRYESRNSLYVLAAILRQTDVAGLERVSKDVNASFVRMVQEGANAHMIGSAMSVIGRAFKQRLLELAEQQLGAPPIAYCFLALGSMARDEQLVVTDQDNALILHDDFNTEQHGEYFNDLAKFVCDGLDACGYKYCTGGIMATNPKWQKTRAQWQDCFADWIKHPEPEALLNCSIFFDLEGVFGKTAWAEQLNAFIAERAQQSPQFLACLARNALSRTPPLGFFKGFVMEKDGEQRKSINLKRRGTAPLADLVRVHALAVGSVARNSFERIDDMAQAKVLPDGRETDLRDALEFISMVRIRHQARVVEEGREPDNNINPDTLSDFERRNLKEAFTVLSNAQRFVKFRYPFSRT